MASLRDLLTDGQYNWLNDNLDRWYDEENIIICKQDSWSYIAILQSIPGLDTQISYLSIGADGTPGSPSYRTISDTTGQWYQMYNGIYPGETVFYKNFGDNQVDSYDTIGLPELPTTRVVVDTQDLVAVKDSNWNWMNLYNILTGLQSRVEVIPSDNKERRNLAYEWDNDMAYRIWSPYMMAWVKGMLTEDNIVSYLASMYADKWNKMYDVMTEEYNPLDNYNMNETEHTDDVRDEHNTSTGSTTNTSTDNNTTDNKVYAYNSSDASDDSKTISNGGNTSSGTANNSAGYTTDNDLDRTLSRSGNIGVTTSQQMAESELKLREHIVLNTVRDDITAVLTLPYYGGKY